MASPGSAGAAAKLMMGDFFGVGNSDLPKSNCATAAAPTTLDETGCSEVSTTVGNADKDDTNSFGRPICLPIELHDNLLRQNLAFKNLL